MLFIFGEWCETLELLFFFFFKFVALSSVSKGSDSSLMLDAVVEVNDFKMFLKLFHLTFWNLQSKL